MVLLANGKLAGIRSKPGLFCVNPCCTKTMLQSLKQQSFDLKTTKIIDKKGNPIMVSAIVIMRVQNLIRSTLEVQNVQAYVQNAATAVMKQVASKYAYETPDNSISLKTHAAEIGQEMVVLLQEKVNTVGTLIVDMMLNELSYAPEIASSMLQRQQAEALIDARSLIVQGAVDIARNASEQLKTHGIDMAQSEKARMVSNLICVICGDARENKH